MLDLTNKKIYFTDTIAKDNFSVDMGKLNFSPGAPEMYLAAYREDLFGDVTKLFSPLE